MREAASQEKEIWRRWSRRGRSENEKMKVKSIQCNHHPRRLRVQCDYKMGVVVAQLGTEFSFFHAYNPRTEFASSYPPTYNAREAESIFLRASFFDSLEMLIRPEAHSCQEQEKSARDAMGGGGKEAHYKKSNSVHVPRIVSLHLFKRKM